MTARVVGVVGTDTGAGKTVISAALAVALRGRGLAVDALKPVATGVDEGASGEDAAMLAHAVDRRPEECVLHVLRLPRSPLAAATAEGRMVDVDDLVMRIRERALDADVLILEGIGGVLVPLTDRVTVVDLMRRLGASVLVAGRSGLGTVNHCALTVEACRNRGLEVIGVVLSDVDGATDADFARENAEQIARQCDVRILAVLPHVDITAPGCEGWLVHGLAAAIDVSSVAEALRIDTRERVVNADRAHVWHPFTQTAEWLNEAPPVIRSGAGCTLVDESGRRYLDAISSLWANVHGHAHPRLDRALHEQAGRIAHSTFLGQTHGPGALLAEELCAVAPAGLSRIFYSEAGAAAVEVALRIALLAQHHRGEPERTRFLSVDDAYHGDTAGAVSVGRSEPFHGFLDPLLFDAVRTPSPHVVGEQAALAALRECFATSGSSMAALVLEPRVQAAAGIWPHSDEWLRSAVEIARAAGALVICDEVATGFGRTGDLFASSGAGIVPDILCLGKGLTGGYLPLAATLVSEHLFDLFTGPYADHRTLYYGHTFTANPIACAVARASLALFADEEALESGRRVAGRLAERLPDLRAQPMVKVVRQRGVMVGIELAQEYGMPFDPSLRMGRRVCLAARERGVIVRPLGDVIVLNPPLVMTDGEVDIIVTAVANAIAAISIGNA